MSPEIWKKLSDERLGEALKNCSESTQREVAEELKSFV
jgi:hypothetical protein